MDKSISAITNLPEPTMDDKMALARVVKKAFGIFTEGLMAPLHIADRLGSQVTSIPAQSGEATLQDATLGTMLGAFGFTGLGGMSTRARVTNAHKVQADLAREMDRVPGWANAKGRTLAQDNHVDLINEIQADIGHVVKTAGRLPDEYWDYIGKASWNHLEDGFYGRVRPSKYRHFGGIKNDKAMTPTHADPNAGLLDHIRSQVIDRGRLDLEIPSLKLKDLQSRASGMLPHEVAAHAKAWHDNPRIFGKPFRKTMVSESSSGMKYSDQLTEIHASILEQVAKPLIESGKVSKAQMDFVFDKTLKLAKDRKKLITKEREADFWSLSNTPEGKGLDLSFDSKIKPNLTRGELTPSAIKFGKAATPAQVKELELNFQRQQFKYRELMDAGKYEQAATEGYKSQWFREALEAAKGKIDFRKLPST